MGFLRTRVRIQIQTLMLRKTHLARQTMPYAYVLAKMYTAVPPFSGPSDRRTPAMGGHFSHVQTTF